MEKILSVEPLISNIDRNFNYLWCFFMANLAVVPGSVECFVCQHCDRLDTFASLFYLMVHVFTLFNSQAVKREDNMVVLDDVLS